jgi:hypothetical protein
MTCSVLCEKTFFRYNHARNNKIPHPPKKTFYHELFLHDKTLKIALNYFEFSLVYPVKKDVEFPVPRRDVTDQTLSGRE